MTRRARIVATIGPASESEEMLSALILAGMNVARLNFSHGTHEWHAAIITRIRTVAGRLGKTVGILQDLQGPKIRTGALASGQPVLLVDGKPFTITNRPVEGTAETVSTTYASLPGDVRPNDTILLSDGAIELRTVAVDQTNVHCTVVHGGVLKEHQGINLPGVAVSAPALTEKDQADLAFGLEQGVDFVALSFVRQAADALAARQMIEAHVNQPDLTDPDAEAVLVQENPRQTRPGGWRGPLLIAKLEKPQAIDNLAAIVDVVDGVMVARGDMEVELSTQQVPTAQKTIIEAANCHGRLVITATQMLESMVTNPRPTRAEASDVANAIYDGTDAVMLSAETASGHYPVEAVRTMSSIIAEAERHLDEWGRWRPQHPPTEDNAVSIARAAAELARDRDVTCIAAFTKSGRTASLLAKERPHVPIIALTPYEAVTRRLTLTWGVQSICVPQLNSVEAMFREVEQELLTAQLVQAGNEVIITGGLPIAGDVQTNFIKLHRVENNTKG